MVNPALLSLKEFVLVCVTKTVPSAQHVEKEQEKQASDPLAVLQDELIQAAVRERQLQMQLDKMKDDVSRLQTLLDERPNLQKELELEQQMKQRDSVFNDFSVLCCGPPSARPPYAVHPVCASVCLSVLCLHVTQERKD